MHPEADSNTQTVHVRQSESMEDTKINNLNIESIAYDVQIKNVKQSIYRILEENPSSTALAEGKINESHTHYCDIHGIVDCS
jgi:beta-galactosidase beta subunit